MKNSVRFTVVAMLVSFLLAISATAQLPMKIETLGDTLIDGWHISRPEGVWWYSQPYPGGGMEVHSYHQDGRWIASSVIYFSEEQLIAIPLSQYEEKKTPPIPFERTGLGPECMIWIDSVYWCLRHHVLKISVDMCGLLSAGPLQEDSMVWQGLTGMKCRPVVINDKTYFIKAFSEYYLGFVFYDDLAQQRIAGVLMVMPHKVIWDPETNPELREIGPLDAIQKVVGGWQFRWPPEKK